MRVVVECMHCSVISETRGSDVVAACRHLFRLSWHVGCKYVMTKLCLKVVWCGLHSLSRMFTIHKTLRCVAFEWYDKIFFGMLMRFLLTKLHPANHPFFNRTGIHREHELWRLLRSARRISISQRRLQRTTWRNRSFNWRWGSGKNRNGKRFDSVSSSVLMPIGLCKPHMTQPDDNRRTLS